MKKAEEPLVRTIFPSVRSLITFLIAIFVILGLLLIFRSYSSLVEEKTIEVKTPDDLGMAKQKLQQQVQSLQKELGDLRALVT